MILAIAFLFFFLAMIWNEAPIPQRRTRNEGDASIQYFFQTKNLASRPTVTFQICTTCFFLRILAVLGLSTPLLQAACLQ